MTRQVQQKLELSTHPDKKQTTFIKTTIYLSVTNFGEFYTSLSYPLHYKERDKHRNGAAYINSNCIDTISHCVGDDIFTSMTDDSFNGSKYGSLFYTLNNLCHGFRSSTSDSW